MHAIFDEYDKPLQLRNDNHVEVTTHHNVDSQNVVSLVDKNDDQNDQASSLQSPLRFWRMVGPYPKD